MTSPSPSSHDPYPDPDFGAQPQHQPAFQAQGQPAFPFPVRPQHLPPLPPQPAPGRPRRRLPIGLSALVLVAACAAAAVWWTRGEDGGPLAGRPRVTDTRAGLSYGVPEGWKHDAAKDKDLIDAFSSQVSRRSGKSSPDYATVMAGPSGRTVPQADLRVTTESAARSNAEFFFPDQQATLEDSHATEVDGRPAHTAVLRIQNGDEGTARLEMTLVTVHGEHTAFLLAVTSDAADKRMTSDVHAIIASTTVS